MNKELIFRKIGGIIKEISEQYEYLSANTEHINPLELELFIANAHFLSEHLNILKKMDDAQSSHAGAHLLEAPKSQLTTAEKPDFENKIVEQAEVSKGRPETVLPETSKVEYKAEIPEPVQYNTSELDRQLASDEPYLLEETPAIELKIPEEVVVSLKPEIPEPSEAPEKDLAAEFVIEAIQSDESVKPADTVPERTPTLNELLSANLREKSMASSVSYNEVKDLKSMIKLNDKLLFVRDLFNGYSLAYSEAIEILNRFESFETADNFLKQTYAIKNKWSDKQGTVDHFYEILNRRFN